MDLFALQVFCSLANTLNYRKTAAEMNISQPSVSYHIRNLEAELNIALLKRNRHVTVLTEAGMEFLHYARAITDQERLAKDRMNRIREGITGRITVAGIQTFLSAISAAEADVLNKYPELTIDTYMMDGPQLMQSRRFSEYDIYFCAENMIFDNPEYSEKTICSEYMELYYPAELEDRIDMSDWKKMENIPFVSIIPSNHLLFSRTSHLLRIFCAQPQRISYATTIESILSLISCGCGISILPKGSAPENGYSRIRTKEIRHPDALITMILSCRNTMNPVLRDAFLMR